MKKIFFLLVIIAIAGCSFLINESEKEKNSKIEGSPKLHLVFSHNISGETHPCGCRNFPLGGLPQIYGMLEKLKKSGEIFYVDTGDTFFPSSVIPHTMHSSLGFAGENLAKGLDLLGVKYIVPGDQDLAMNWGFLEKVKKENHFNYLISNIKEGTEEEGAVKSEKFAVLTRGHAKIFLVGFIHPDVFNDQNTTLFKDPIKSMEEILPTIKNAGYDEKNPYHRLIVLSHSGIEYDRDLAEKFPMIDWIIGSHSQSFLRFSTDVGKTKIVQTLSKNHYLGDITIDLSLQSKDDTYELHEIRDELKDEVKPNPFVEFIDNHKRKMGELQMSEQAGYIVDGNKKTKKFPSPNKCVECHKAQGEFWQKTPHSLAYLTLIKAKEENNLTCIECHSHGLNSPNGFKTAKELFLDENKKTMDANYHQNLVKYSEGFTSARKLDRAKIQVISRSWAILDKKEKVSHNFSNVQCLNCHDKNIEHPFDTEAPKPTVAMETKCMTCHTPEQSPEWYQGKKLNQNVYAEKFKKAACPTGI